MCCSVYCCSCNKVKLPVLLIGVSGHAWTFPGSLSPKTRPATCFLQRGKIDSCCDSDSCRGAAVVRPHAIRESRSIVWDAPCDLSGASGDPRYRCAWIGGGQQRRAAVARIASEQRNGLYSKVSTLFTFSGRVARIWCVRSLSLWEYSRNAEVQVLLVQIPWGDLCFAQWLKMQASFWKGQAERVIVCLSLSTSCLGDETAGTPMALLHVSVSVLPVLKHRKKPLLYWSCFSQITIFFLDWRSGLGGS
jgi:hypothetical protein